MSIPGVYVQEVPGDMKTILGVPTSITTFIGRAKRGPVNEPISIYTFGEYESKFGGLWINSTMSFAVRDFFLNGGSQAIIVRLIHGATVSKYELPTSSPSRKLKIVAANPGTWGEKLHFLIDHNTKEDPDSSRFNLTVAEGDGQTETFMNVSTRKTDSLYLPIVLEQQSEFIRISKTSGTYDCPDIRPNETSTPNTICATNRGSDGTDLTVKEYISEGMKNDKQGLWALEKADLFNLLCIPPFSPFCDIATDLIDTAVNYCTERRAFMIIDPPIGWTSSALARSGLESYPGTSSSNAALYFPRLKQPNPLKDGLIEEFVPCGAIAGVIARTDAQSGVWKVPAGQKINLIGVADLSVSLTDDENRVLNTLGINCLRRLPGSGSVVWGARTLQGADSHASEWKYLPVRRTALYIEDSLNRSLKWVVFEPDDEPLWSQIRLNAGAFMHNLFIQGAFQGMAPKDAYFVKCDRETTTQNDINLGIVTILVGFAPLNPAEFVILRIQQKAGKIDQ